jgi:hypothetical protein
MYIDTVCWLCSFIGKNCYGNWLPALRARRNFRLNLLQFASIIARKHTLNYIDQRWYKTICREINNLGNVWSFGPPDTTTCKEAALTSDLIYEI